MKRLLGLLGLLFLFYSFPVLADDSTAKALSSFFSPVPNDQSLLYLSYIFGQVGNLLPSNTAPTGNMILQASILGSMFSVFNKIILSVGTFVVLFSTVAGILNTSNEGEALGRKWSSVWLPIRTVIGVSCLMPGASGYSILQVGLMWIIVHGVGAADELWTTTLKYIQSTNAISQKDFQNPGNGIQSASEAYNIINAAYKGVLCNQFFSEFSNTLFTEIAIDPSKFPKESNFTAVPKPSIAVSELVTAANEKQTIIDYAHFALNTSNSSSENCSPSNPEACINKYQNQVKKECGSITFTQTTDPNSGALIQGLSNAIQDINNNFITIIKPAVQVINEQGGDYLNGASQTPYDDHALRNALEKYISSESPLINAQGKVYMDAMQKIIMNIQVNNVDLAGAFKQMTDVGWLFAGSFYYHIVTLQSKTEGQDIQASKPVAVIGGCPSNTTKIYTACSTLNDIIFKTTQDYCEQLGASASIVKDQGQLQYCTVRKVSNYNTWTKVGNYSVGQQFMDGQGLMALLDYIARMFVMMFIDMVTGSTGGLNPNPQDEQNGFTAFFGEHGPMYQSLQDIQLETHIDGSDVKGHTANDQSDDRARAYGQRNPIIGIQIFGNHMIQVLKWWVIALIMALFVAGLVAGNAASIAAGLGGALKWFYILFSPILMALFGVLFMAGLSMAYYVPLIPFITFFFTSIGWIIAVVESMLAAPIIALGYISPEGDEFWGRANPAIMIMLNIFLRPSFMIFGMIGGMILSFVGASLLNAMYAGVVREMIQGWSVGVTAMISLIVTYVGLILTIMNKSFTMIYTVPNRILRWIGGSEEQTGEAEDVAAVRGIYDSGAEGIGEAGSRIGGGMKKLGEAAATRAHRKGEEKAGNKALQLQNAEKGQENTGGAKANASEKPGTQEGGGMGVEGNKSNGSSSEKQNSSDSGNKRKS